MKLPCYNRLPLRQVVRVADSPLAYAAATALTKLVAELPEVLLAYVFELPHEQLLAYYTSSATYNPHQLTARNARGLRTVQTALAAEARPGAPCLDATTKLSEQAHYIHPLPAWNSYCFAAVPLHAASPGLVRAVLRHACT